MTYPQVTFRQVMLHQATLRLIKTVIKTRGKMSQFSVYMAPVFSTRMGKLFNAHPVFLHPLYKAPCY